MNIETKLVHVGVGRDKKTGSLTTPIYQVATFEHPSLGESTGFDYSRSLNPTRLALEEGIAGLENGDGGFAFASGMAAVTAIFTLFKSGDHFVVTEDAYGGTYRVLEQTFSKFGMSASMVDTSNLEAVEEAIQANTVAIFVESPTNPLVKVADLGKLIQLAKKHQLLTIVDNTFMTPLLQQPLNLGADIVLHSASKYLSGHNDVIAGLVVTKGQELSAEMALIQKSTGGTLGPQDCFLTIRGMKTLALRMDRQLENALAIAKWLDGQASVEKVYYPGLVNSPSYALTTGVDGCYGAMLSFELQSPEACATVLNHIELIKFAESLGGVESLMTYPCTQTHADMPLEFRNRLGINDRLLRFSVGIEHIDDLIDDLKKAFSNL